MIHHGKHLPEALGWKEENSGGGEELGWEEENLGGGKVRWRKRT